MNKYILIFLLILLHCTCYSQQTYPEDLWKGLIGEAVGEGYDGMYAVACVYRNRLEKNMKLGCNALKRKDLNEFIERQGEKYEIMAKNIIRKVFEENSKDITYGATHYENIEDFGIPWWAPDMDIVCKIDKHTFYKEKVYNEK